MIENKWEFQNKVLLYIFYLNERQCRINLFYLPKWIKKKKKYIWKQKTETLSFRICKSFQYLSAARLKKRKRKWQAVTDPKEHPLYD